MAARSRKLRSKPIAIIWANYNTYGPWKIIGGMNKRHPDPEELDAVCGFYAKILSLAEKQRG